MSNYLTGLKNLNPIVTRFDGGSTSYSLPVASTSNQTLVFINGVCQHPSTDYSISSQTLTMSSTVPAGTNVLQVMQMFSTGLVNAPADNSVTGAKLDVSLVQGDVLTATGTDTLARLAKGTANQKLSMNSAANAVEWQTVATPAAGYEFVSVISGNDDATVAFTNMVSGYDYQYRWSNLTPATNDAMFKAELGTSGPSYLTSGYLGTTFEVNSAASVTSYEYTTYMGVGANSNDGTEPDSAAGHWNIFDPAGSGVTKVMGQSIRRNSGHTFYNGLDHWYHDTAASHVAIKFYFSSGNVEAGVFVQYRRKLSA